MTYKKNYVLLILLFIFLNYTSYDGFGVLDRSQSGYLI